MNDLTRNDDTENKEQTFENEASMIQVTQTAESDSQADSMAETAPTILAGTDAQTDIAILKIAATGLTAATIGNSSTLAVGDQVVAVGNPLGELGGTVTDGIVSALDREITLDNETKRLLQTNTAINPGNSGGGLFDNTGSLIAIVEAKSSGTGLEGLGFAIPINSVRSVIDELINFSYVRGRIDLGMTLVDINTQQLVLMYRVPQMGVYVLKVISGGGADQSGLQSGDCILTVDGTEVASAADLNAIIEKHKVGDALSVTVLRNRQQQTNHDLIRYRIHRI